MEQERREGRGGKGRRRRVNQCMAQRERASFKAQHDRRVENKSFELREVRLGFGTRGDGSKISCRERSGESK